MDAPVDVFVGKNVLPVTKVVVIDEHHTLARELNSKHTVQKEFA